MNDEPTLVTRLGGERKERDSARSAATAYGFAALIFAMAVAVAGKPDDLGSHSFFVIAGCLFIAREIALLRSKI